MPRWFEKKYGSAKWQKVKRCVSRVKGQKNPPSSPYGVCIASVLGQTKHKRGKSASRRSR